MKELTILFFSSWKFAATFPVAVVLMHMSFSETLILTNTGGILGAVIFTYFSKTLIYTFNKYWPEKWNYHHQSKVIFTKSNRRLVRLKLKYGFPGIVILSPILLSIPLGSFLTVKYYEEKYINVLWLIAGQIGWSLVFTYFYTYLYRAI